MNTVRSRVLMISRTSHTISAARSHLIGGVLLHNPVSLEITLVAQRAYQKPGPRKPARDQPFPPARFPPIFSAPGVSSSANCRNGAAVTEARNQEKACYD